MPSKPLLIIQMGLPPQDIIAQFGEQGRWMLEALGEDAPAALIVQPFLGEALPDPADVSGAVLTGSWNMVTDREPWSEATAQWVRQAMLAQLPLLGICYGHQLMAHALGGVVGYHPQGREVGHYEIELIAEAEHDPLLVDLPARFTALLSHEQTVITPPPGARVLARSAHDPHQILRYSDRAVSVQFHPEFTVPLMRACITRRAAQLDEEGFDSAAMLQTLASTPEAHQILLAFAQRL